MILIEFVVFANINQFNIGFGLVKQKKLICGYFVHFNPPWKVLYFTQKENKDKNLSVKSKKYVIID